MPAVSLLCRARAGMLLVAGVCLLWLAVAPTADAASPVEAAITRTAENLGRQMRADYNHAGRGRRRSYALPSTDLLVVDHRAPDLAKHKASEYELAVTLTKATHTVAAVEIRERIDLTDTTALTEFAISRTDSGKAWIVSLDAEQADSRFQATYYYVTGGPLARLPEAFPLTLHDFRLLAGLGQAMLTNARAGRPINYLQLPFPPPGGASPSTASASAATSATVYLDQPGLSNAAQPSSFRIAEYESADMQTLANSAVSAVSWSNWGSATAEGTGQALIQWTDATTGLHAQERATVPVVVSASGLRSCGGVSVYTSLVINPAAGATVPPHFAQVQHDDKITACTVHGGSYVAGKEERTDPNGCFFKGLKELVIQPPFSLNYCAMRWKGWGGSTATGEGVARIGYKQYGLRVRLSRVRWCKQWTVSYTQEIAEVWGAGEALTGIGNVSAGEAARLRALIGRGGEAHKVVRLTMPGGAGCVG